MVLKNFSTSNRDALSSSLPTRAHQGAGERTTSVVWLFKYRNCQFEFTPLGHRVLPLGIRSSYHSIAPYDLLAAAEDAKDSAMLLVGNHARGTILFQLGELGRIDKGNRFSGSRVDSNSRATSWPVGMPSENVR
jgi:hypothetical protein